jgi:hypothetical protein
MTFFEAFLALWYTLTGVGIAGTMQRNGQDLPTPLALAVVFFWLPIILLAAPFEALRNVVR